MTLIFGNAVSLGLVCGLHMKVYSMVPISRALHTKTTAIFLGQIITYTIRSKAQDKAQGGDKCYLLM